MEKYFGFTEDKVFGKVMSNKKFCKIILQTILDNFKIKIDQIDYLDDQKSISSPVDSSKDIRLDILVRSGKKLYNIEMQRSNNHNLGERMRYYQSQIDKFSLDRGETYNNIKESFIIFLCNFDFFDAGKMIYSFHLYEDKNKEIKLDNKSHNIIINAKGTHKNQSENMIALVNLMNENRINLNSPLAKVQAEIDRINNDPKERKIIMDYETHLLAEKQDSKAEGRMEGIKQGTLAVIKGLDKRGFSKNEILDFVISIDNTLSKDEKSKLVDEYFTK